ncbi:MAG: invasion associated locus B family protein [Gammaproteobacteria bacterium]|nr:invasion associated locus B family protein [Gammaproteobacteria bacterium]MCP5138109.1 invasion associated locus B family protein [Gammaproteobacteria bacterium]
MTRFSAALLSLSMLVAPAAVFAKPDKDAVFKDWRGQCETPEGSDQEICHVFQNLVVKETQQQLLHVMVLQTPKREEPVMIATLPLGVALRPGIQIQVDEVEPFSMMFETCTPVGCRAGLLLKPEILSAFQKGAKGTVSFFNLQGKRLNVPLSLNGFTQAVASLK